MRFQFVGCGDAFGSGGRFNTCFHVTGERTNLLIDCGATSIVALKRSKVALNDIGTILITHFHADHFGGIPALMLDAQFFSKRTAPLTIAGPEGLPDWYRRVMETAFPGSSTTKPRFDLRLTTLSDDRAAEIDGVRVRPYRVNHGNPGGPFFGYRIDADDLTIAYTGDTEWTDALVDLGRDADLLVAEAYFYDKSVPLHLDLASLEAHLPSINPHRLFLTHMSEDMLARRAGLPYETAEDGLVVTL